MMSGILLTPELHRSHVCLQYGKYCATGLTGLLAVILLQRLLEYLSKDLLEYLPGCLSEPLSEFVDLSLL